MLVLAGLAESPEEGRAKIADALDSAAGLEVFRRMIEAQGGDPRVVDTPGAVLPHAANHRDLEADRAGVVAAVRARSVGVAALLLGAGRTRTTDSIDPAAGVELRCRLGDRVEAGQVVATLHYNDRDPEPAMRELAEAIDIAEELETAPRTSRVIEILR
jgi:thymidine phosphorylase